MKLQPLADRLIVETFEEEELPESGSFSRTRRGEAAAGPCACTGPGCAEREWSEHPNRRR